MVCPSVDADPPRATVLAIALICIGCGLMLDMFWPVEAVPGNRQASWISRDNESSR